MVRMSEGDTEDDGFLLMGTTDVMYQITENESLWSSTSILGKKGYTTLVWISDPMAVGSLATRQRITSNATTTWRRIQKSSRSGSRPRKQRQIGMKRNNLKGNYRENKAPPGNKRWLCLKSRQWRKRSARNKEVQKEIVFNQWGM